MASVSKYIESELFGVRRGHALAPAHSLSRDRDQQQLERVLEVVPLVVLPLATITASLTLSPTWIHSS